MTGQAKLRRWIVRYGRAREGATAVEFALIALPFFALLLGVLELGLIYVLSASLDNAATQVSRDIRTGYIKKIAKDTGAQVRDEICNRMGWAASVSDCQKNIAVFVEKRPDFSPPTDDPFKNNPFKNDVNYAPTGPGEIVLVRVYYKWDVITPILGQATANSGDGVRLITTSLVFRNEPFT